MAARRNTKHTPIPSTEADEYLKNLNYSAKFKATTSDHEVQRVLNFMKVCEASSSGTPKINSTPKDDLDEGDLPQPTAPRQRSPPQYDLDLNDLPQHTVTPQCSSMQYDLEHRVLLQSTASTQGSIPKYDFDLNELPQPTASPQGSPAQVKLSDLRSHQDSHVEECKNIPSGIN
ncbi:uncharacterized protein LOC126614249 [Malus sylvestris]|uniref:uncharacterized protein LOC126614249 n=1 Tax=Malus sylvestris TaxID=3752 RepID=UPI0021ACA799|nr:uncharacterized protein LOC126614249 [Malus sylvestris]